MTKAQVPTDLLEAGRAALKDGEWSEARNLFEKALSTEQTPEAFEGLSWAAWYLNDAETLFEAREKAYVLYRSLGNNKGAARIAGWLGTDHVDFRGERAVAQGWFGRARRLLEDVELGAEHGWLWVHEAEKLIAANDTEAGLDLARKTIELGRTLGLVDLEMMGRATEGLALVTDGCVEEGVASLDQAAAAALGGELSEPWSGWCLCYMLYACERVRDFDRADQWCKRVEKWAQKKGLSMIGPSCRAHYGGVLVWRGTWSEAETELMESAKRLSQVRPPIAAEATVRLGELRRRQGRLEEASDLFEQVSDHPLALLGLAEICLDRGDPEGARDRAEAYLREVPQRTLTLRADGLEVLIRAEVALGNHAAAQAALEELDHVAVTVDTDPLRGGARFAAGTVAAASGDEDVARVAFEDASRIFQRSKAPFETGLARLELARTLRRLGRRRDAGKEAEAALEFLRAIGASRATAQAEELLRDLADKGASPLTKREREVLGLVAEGLGDKAVAERLVLSEHTIHRHVANIMTKLGCTSRAAAVAEAVRKGWT